MLGGNEEAAPAGPGVKLSLAMIVKDEAGTIARVLKDAAAFCDELVVVDTGSTDATREIAAEHGAVVSSLAWEDDFGAARNASFQRCTGDWVVWLDADDVVPPESQRAFRAVKAELTDEIDGVFSPYHYRIGDDGRPLLSFHRERLLRRAAGLRWAGRVHECIRVPADRSVLRSDLVVEHRPDPARRALNSDRNINILAKAIAARDRGPRTLFYYANELYDHQRYGEAAQHYREYLVADVHGADRYWAQAYLAECLRVLGDLAGARRAALDAIGEDSGRAEGYVTLGRVHFDAGEWEEAIPLFVAATAGRRPAFGFVRDSDYGYAPWDFLSVCYEKLGRMDEALTAAQRGLPGNPEVDRMRSNMHWMVDHL